MCRAFLRKMCTAKGLSTDDSYGEISTGTETPALQFIIIMIAEGGS